MKNQIPLLWCTLSLLGSSAALAQSPTSVIAAEREHGPAEFFELLHAPDFDARALHANPHELTARGSNFAALIGEGRLAFYPSGDGLPGLELMLETAGRVDAPNEVASGRTAAEGLTGIVQRGPLLQERYDVRATGLYQSVVFAERPAGTGDLVVRQRVTTELSAALTENGLSFEWAGREVLTIGSVEGIDATGETFTGQLNFDGELLEYRLAADFVDRAKFPLVVDPLIGSTTSIGTFADLLSDPAVAFDASTGTYMMVCVYNGSTFKDIDGYVLDPSLNTIVGPITIDWDNGDDGQTPTIASINSRNRFLVAWEDNAAASHSNIGMRAMDPQNMNNSSEVLVGATSLNEIRPFASGNRSTQVFSDRAFIAFERLGSGIQVAEIVLSFSGIPSVSMTHDLTLANCSLPQMSRSGGNQDRWAVTWIRDNAGTRTVQCAILGVNGQILSQPQSIAGVSGSSTFGPSIDGDGDRWLLTWLRDAITFPFPIGARIRAVCLEWNGQNMFLAIPDPPFTLATATGLFSTTYCYPHVVYTGNRYLVAFRSQQTSPFDGSLSNNTQLASVNEDACELCTGLQNVGSMGSIRFNTNINAQWASGVNNDEALVIWDDQDSNGTRGIYGHSAEGILGDSVLNLGGGCGSGGILSADIPHVGNATFRLHVTNAASTATTALISVNQQPQLWSCGGCTINVNVNNLQAIGMTNGFGHLSVPIPCDSSFAGFVGHAQAISVFPTATSPCPLFGNSSATNRLQITIGH